MVLQTLLAIFGSYFTASLLPQLLSSLNLFFCPNFDSSFIYSEHAFRHGACEALLRSPPLLFYVVTSLFRTLLFPPSHPSPAPMIAYAPAPMIAYATLTRARAQIFRQGSKMDSLMIIVSGSIELRRSSSTEAPSEQ
eukprot:6210821-Pleurochrysis_carterae.AAC.5